MDLPNFKDDYVSKSDIYSYSRCPYSFHLVESGLISPAQVFSRIEHEMLADGVAFEEAVLEEMPTTSRRINDPMLGEEVDHVFNVPTSRNHMRKLSGRPDGIDLSAHAPIEIKNHGSPKRMDRLELAFYWLLLEPMRTMTDVAPYGWLYLFGGHRRVRVKVLPEHLAKVNALIANVRRARREGVEPRPCECYVCAARPEVQEVYSRRSDVGLILNISTVRAEVLRNVGVSTVAAFADADPIALARSTKALSGRALSATLIRTAQPHARALRDNMPVWLTDDRLKDDGFIALDLEYLSGPQAFLGSANEIFLVGALVQQNGENELFQVLCESPAQLHDALRALVELLQRYKTLPVYTWNGESADMLYLARAARSHRLRIMPTVAKRHRDLYRFAQRVVRLPVAGQSLKSVGKFLGVAREGDLVDGRAAVALFLEMLELRGKKQKAAAANVLLRYNENDLRALAAAADFFRTRTTLTRRAAPDADDGHVSEWDGRRPPLPPRTRTIKGNVTYG